MLIFKKIKCSNIFYNCANVFGVKNGISRCTQGGKWVLMAFFYWDIFKIMLKNTILLLIGTP